MFLPVLTVALTLTLHSYLQQNPDQICPPVLQYILCDHHSILFPTNTGKVHAIEIRPRIRGHSINKRIKLFWCGIGDNIMDQWIKCWIHWV